MPSSEAAPRVLLATIRSISSSNASHRSCQVDFAVALLPFVVITPMRSAKNLKVFGGNDSFSSCHSGEVGLQQ